MRKALTLTLAATTALSAVAFSTAASAYDYRDSYYRGHDNSDVAGAAIAAGVIGLVIGAALASNHNSYDNGYYNNRGYNYGGYSGYGGYGYSQPYSGSGYYGGGSRYGYGDPYSSGYGYNQPYYGGGYGYQRCYTTRSWDPYYRGYTNRRVCR